MTKVTTHLAGGAGGILGSMAAGGTKQETVGAAVGTGIGALFGPAGILLGGALGSMVGSAFNNKKDYRVAATPMGGDTLYNSYTDASIAANPFAWTGGKLKNKWQILAGQWDLEKQREIQSKELEALRSSARTVSYGTAITDVGNLSGEVTTEEQRAASLAALEEEEELLGKRVGSLGSTSLVGLR